MNEHGIRLSRLLTDRGQARGSPPALVPVPSFYDSTGTNKLIHTCNTWTAEVLRVAGLPVTAAGIVFAAQSSISFRHFGASNREYPEQELSHCSVVLQR
jgi:hypothetical protein